MGLGGVLLLLLVASVQVLAAGAATNRVCTPRSLQPALHNIEATDCVSYAPVLLPGVQVNPDAALENSPTLATTEVLHLPHHHLLPGSWQLAAAALPSPTPHSYAHAHHIPCVHGAPHPPHRCAMWSW